MKDPIKYYLCSLAPANGWTSPDTPEPPPVTEYLVGLAVLGLCLTIAWLGMQP